MNQASNPVDPNRGPIVDSKTPQSSDKEEERDLKLADELMSQGKAARKDNDTDWSKRQDYYDGKQWSSEKYASLYKSRPVMNIIRQAIQQQIPIITDLKPAFTVLPKEPADFEFASMVQELTDAWWTNNEMDLTLIQGLTDEMILDAGILKTTWDPEADLGVGEIKTECANPWDIFVPYGATDFDKNCPWVIHRSYKPISELKEMFPEHADEIKDDAQAGGVDNSSSTAIGNDLDVKFISPTDQWTPKGTDSGTGTGDDQRKTAEVWEIWYKDSATENIKDGEGKDIKKKKYPRGALMTVLPNQKLRLQKVGNPYMHGKWPFVRMVDTVKPRKFWGEGECKVLMPIQRMLNKSLAHVFDNLNMMSNAVWMVENDSGVSPEQITNAVSSVLLCTPGSNAQNKIKRDFGPAMPPSTEGVLNLVFRMAEMTSGISEITAGRKPPGVSAAAALETLEQASQTRIRLKERNLQAALSQLGRQVVALMLQFYKEPRIVRITGKEDTWPEFTEFFIEDSAEGGYVLNKKKYATQINTETGQPVYVPAPEFSQIPAKGTMDIKVVSGQALPWAKTSRANIAFRLFDSEAIDAGELLKALDWPDAEKITQKLKSQTPEQPPAPGGPE